MSLSTNRVVRTVRLLELPAAATVDAGRSVLRTRLRGDDPEAVRLELRRAGAARTRRVLGGLKGGALKTGQLLSTVEALFPPDPEASWSEALAGLQEDNPPLPFADLLPTLDQELPGWRRDLPELDPRAAAAASLGQVHRGRWRDGREVAVKVQYPGVADALAGDVATLAAVLRLSALVARGLSLPPLVHELRTRLAEELDYEREADHQARFAAHYRDHPDVVVPEVVAATPRVLVTTWLDGTPLARLADPRRPAPAERRDRAGLLYQRFLLSGPSLVGLLHTDPHPGNFRLTDDDRLGVLDFGSTLAMPDGMPDTFGRLIRVLLAGDPADVLGGLQAAGFVRPDRHLTVDDARKLVDYLAPFSEPARHEVFGYSRAWLRSEFGRVNDPRDPDFAVALKLNLPAEHLFTHRVWLGVVGVLSQLEATVPVAPELRRWLPGFASQDRPGER